MTITAVFIMSSKRYTEEFKINACVKCEKIKIKIKFNS